MTSIEWLIEQIKEYDFTPPSNNEEYVIVMPKWIFDAKRDEAKEMHKQEIIDAQSYAISNADMTNNKGYFDCEQYYQETFVSKGSDDTLKDYHIVDTNKMVELPKQDVDKFEKFLDNEIELGLSPKDTIERIKWYYKTYFKQTKKD